MSLERVAASYGIKSTFRIGGFFGGEPSAVALGPEHGTSGRISGSDSEEEIADEQDNKESQSGEQNSFSEISI